MNGTAAHNFLRCITPTLKAGTKRSSFKNRSSKISQTNFAERMKRTREGLSGYPTPVWVLADKKHLPREVSEKPGPVGSRVTIDRSPQRRVPDDVHDPCQIIGKDRKRHLGGYFWERLGEKVCRSRAGLHRTERMLDRLATQAPGILHPKRYGFEQGVQFGRTATVTFPFETA